MRTNLDDDGFLNSPGDWNERLALWLAKQEGLEVLSEARWQVIYALRMAGLTDPGEEFKAYLKAEVYCIERQTTPIYYANK